MVNTVLPYSSHRKSNVIGTKHILQFSFSSQTPKIINYISTAGILCGIKSENEDIPSKYIDKLGGYGQSKWVAEQLLMMGSRRNCPIRIFRPATISGHTKTGASNPRDFVNLLTCGLAEERLYANDSKSPLPLRFDLVPVDYVASAIVQISIGLPPSNSSHPDTNLPIYHLVANGDEGLFKFDSLIDYLQSYGFGMKSVSAEEFCNRITCLSEDHPLFMFKSMLSNVTDGKRLDCYCPDDKNTRQALQQCNASYSCCPSITETVFHRYINNFIQKKMLSKPDNPS